MPDAKLVPKNKSHTDTYKNKIIIENLYHNNSKDELSVDSFRPGRSKIKPIPEWASKWFKNQVCT